MSRLSFRPRPLDIHKKLPIVKSVKEFEDDDTTTSTRNSHILRLAAEADNEVQHVVTKRLAHEIPIPQFVVVDTYERDYTRTFAQPTSYLRARGARSELGDFVEYDLDNEDEDWLEEFNKEKPNITPEEFEVIIFKLEVFDHKARERAGVITPTLGSPIPVLLRFDAAVEAMLSMSVTYGVFQSIYNYWKEKRERWQKPILRRLQVLVEWRSCMPLSLVDHLLHFIDSLIRFSEQLYIFRFPPPPVNDTNPYNVFRPREKAHRLHTRRMQRRENNVQSFERLRQVRRNIDQAKTLLVSLIKREEKKREVMEIEVSLQRIQMKYKDEAELLDDSLVMSGLQSYYNKFVSSEDEFVDADDIMNNLAHTRISAIQNTPYADSKLVMVSNMKRDFRRKNTRQGWLHKLDPSEPVLMFTKPLDSEKLAGAGIVAPQVEVDSDRPYKYHGRIGRGGRIVFDRWNPLAFEN